jgi:hypothetical protein
MYDHFHATLKDIDTQEISHIEGGLMPRDPINTGEYKMWGELQQSAYLDELSSHWGKLPSQIVISFQVAG